MSFRLVLTNCQKQFTTSSSSSSSIIAAATHRTIVSSTAAALSSSTTTSSLLFSSLLPTNNNNHHHTSSNVTKTAISINTNPIIDIVPSHESRRSMTVLSKQSKEEYEKMNYTTRMKASGKPVSPHVLIYAFPIAAISSITNRVTGCVLSVGCAGLGTIELLFGSGSCIQFMDIIGSQGFLIASAAKFSVAFPVTYHYLGALRHFAWDRSPELLGSNAEVAKSAYILFGSATTVSVIAALL